MRESSPHPAHSTRGWKREYFKSGVVEFVPGKGGFGHVTDRRPSVTCPNAVIGVKIATHRPTCNGTPVLKYSLFWPQVAASPTATHSPQNLLTSTPVAVSQISKDWSSNFGHGYEDRVRAPYGRQ